MASRANASSELDPAPVCPCPWPEKPNRLVSLWEIVNHFALDQFTILVWQFGRYHGIMEFAIHEGKGEVVHNDASMNGIIRSVNDLQELCRSAGLWNSATKCLFSSNRLSDPQKQFNASALSVEFANIQETLALDMMKHQFFHLSEDRLVYFDRVTPWGQRVNDAFPSASFDILEAGNCLAVERSTAAVFHLMRVAEYGLRALARDRRIKLSKKSHAIELATWDEIIRGIENAEMAIQGYPKTLAREAQYEFYHGAMLQFRRFKNVFRNRIMHTREDFGRTQALGVFENVGEFMNILASRISETKRTPLIWKGKKWTSIES